MDSSANGRNNAADSSNVIIKRENESSTTQLVNEQQDEPDSTTVGYPDELEDLIRESLNGSASADNVAALRTLANNLANQNRAHHQNPSADYSFSEGEEEEGAAVLDRKEFDEMNRIINSDHAEDGQVVIDGFELPKSLIITNIDSRVFQVGTEERNTFERTFRAIDPTAVFLYFRSFRRARVDFSASVHATKARILCNQLRIGEEEINVYYAEITEVPAENRHLRPPALEKQFLISPPASPPEGWEPSEEAQPVMNIDLQSALANLLPGTSHELHAATDDQPGIFVHICSDTTITTTTDQNTVSSASRFVDVDEDEEDENDDEDDGKTQEVNIFEPKVELITYEEVNIYEPKVELVTYDDELMGSDNSNLNSFKGSPSFQMMGFGGGVGSGGGLSRKIPHTACPPSMSSLASSARRSDN